MRCAAQMAVRRAEAIATNVAQRSVEHNATSDRLLPRLMVDCDRLLADLERRVAPHAWRPAQHASRAHQGRLNRHYRHESQGGCQALQRT